MERPTVACSIAKRFLLPNGNLTRSIYLHLNMAVYTARAINYALFLRLLLAFFTKFYSRYFTAEDKKLTRLTLGIHPRRVATQKMSLHLPFFSLS